MRVIRTISFLIVAVALHAADIRAIIPKNGVPPIGPYSPGVLAGDYLYVSGQGAKRPDGQMPATFAEQTRQTLENVKNVVYAQVYLDDIHNFAAMNRVYAEYFGVHTTRPGDNRRREAAGRNAG